MIGAVFLAFVHREDHQNGEEEDHTEDDDHGDDGFPVGLEESWWAVDAH